MADADDYELIVMNLQHFRSDSVDIRIRINPEILIRISDGSWLRFRPWRSLRYTNRPSCPRAIIICAYKLFEV